MFELVSDIKIILSTETLYTFIVVKSKESFPRCTVIQLTYISSENNPKTGFKSIQSFGKNEPKTSFFIVRIAVDLDLY